MHYVRKHLHDHVEHKHSMMALSLALAVATSFLNLAALPFAQAEDAAPSPSVTAPAVVPDTSQPVQPPVAQPQQPSGAQTPDQGGQGQPQQGPNPGQPVNFQGGPNQGGPGGFQGGHNGGNDGRNFGGPHGGPQGNFGGPGDKGGRGGFEGGPQGGRGGFGGPMGGRGFNGGPGGGQNGGPGGDQMGGQNGDQGGEGDQGGSQDYCDPRQAYQALQGVRQLKIQLRNILRQATQLQATSAIEKAKELSDKVATYEQNIKNPPADSTACTEAQTFFEDRPFDDVEQLRSAVEIPRQLKDIAKSITRIEKVLASKSMQKSGLDLDKLNQVLANIKATYQKAQDAVTSGDYDAARDAMQDFYEGGHPGMFEGAVQRIKGIKEMLRSIRDKQITAAVEEIMGPVYQSLYDGDFQEVNDTLNQYEPQLRQLVNIIMRSHLGYDKVESKLSGLEELIQQKSDELNQKQQDRVAQQDGNQSGANTNQ